MAKMNYDSTIANPEYQKSLRRQKALDKKKRTPSSTVETQIAPTPRSLSAAIECIAFIRSESQFRLVRDSEVAAIIDRMTAADDLFRACKSVAGVFEGQEDAPLYARRCIAAIEKATSVASGNEKV